MSARRSILSKEEKEVLILAAPHPSGQHLNNTEIGQRLGISAARVKTLIHQACMKMGTHNRNEAISLAVRQGQIRIDELYSLDELAELFCSFNPDIFERIARLVRENLDYGQLLCENEQIIFTNRIQDTVLTKSERDVLILVGRGLSNKEIASKLYISFNAVRTFLYRVYTKLGTHNRVDAVLMAVKRGEISMDEMFSVDELLFALTILEAESLEKLAQLLSEKLGQEPVKISS